MVLEIIRAEAVTMGVGVDREEQSSNDLTLKVPSVKRLGI